MDERTLAEEASAQAVHTARKAADAVEVSREVHQQELLVQTKELVIEALREVFGKGDEGASGEMNILVRRIPFICNDIAQIHKDIADTKDGVEEIRGNIKWGVRLVIGAVILALVGMLIKTQI